MRFNHEILKSYGSSTPLAARRLVRAFAETSSHTATVLWAVFLWKGTQTLHFVILLGGKQTKENVVSKMSLPAQCARWQRSCGQPATSQALRKNTVRLNQGFSRTLCIREGGDRSAWKVTHVASTSSNSHLSFPSGFAPKTVL